MSCIQILLSSTMWRPRDPRSACTFLWGWRKGKEGERDQFDTKEGKERGETVWGTTELPLENSWSKPTRYLHDGCRIYGCVRKPLVCRELLTASTSLLCIETTWVQWASIAYRKKLKQKCFQFSQPTQWHTLFSKRPREVTADVQCPAELSAEAAVGAAVFFLYYSKLFEFMN